MVFSNSPPDVSELAKVRFRIFFIAFKLTGTFIDFMLGLSNSEKKSEDLKSAKIKNLLGSEIVDSFNFRTCVKPKLTNIGSGETKIVYQSLTAQGTFQKFSRTSAQGPIFEAGKVRKFRRGSSVRKHC